MSDVLPEVAAPFVGCKSCLCKEWAFKVYGSGTQCSARTESSFEGTEVIKLGLGVDEAVEAIVRLFLNVNILYIQSGLPCSVSQAATMSSLRDLLP